MSPDSNSRFVFPALSAERFAIATRAPFLNFVVDRMIAPNTFRKLKEGEHFRRNASRGFSILSQNPRAIEYPYHFSTIELSPHFGMQIWDGNRTDEWIACAHVFVPSYMPPLVFFAILDLESQTGFERVRSSVRRSVIGGPPVERLERTLERYERSPEQVIAAMVLAVEEDMKPFLPADW